MRVCMLNLTTCVENFSEVCAVNDEEETDGMATQTQSSFGESNEYYVTLTDMTRE